MLDFFLSLFLAPYYLFRYGLDKEIGQLRDREIAKWDEDSKRSQDAWEDLVTDVELEKEMWRIAKGDWRKEPYYTEYLEAVKDINSYSGVLEPLVYRLENKCYYGLDFSDLRLFILMVNRGKLPFSQAYLGFSLIGGSKSLYCGCMSGESLRLCYDLAVWAARRLRGHGVNAVLVKHSLVTRGYEYLNSANWNELAYFKWEPTIMKHVKIKGVREFSMP